MLTLSEVGKAFGGRSLFADATLQVNREDRIGLVGPNGAGKSTLFALILGTESPDAGTITFQRGVLLGHLPQETVAVGGETVLELATSITPEMVRLQQGMKDLEAGSASADFHDLQSRFNQMGGHEMLARAKQILAGLGFRERDFERPARELSGGWTMRARLAGLLVFQPDLLMLDEPTNHLDLDALLWFQNYLQHYPGGLLLISHDRDFLNQVATHIVEIRQARLLRYRGNYDAYLEQREAVDEQHLAAWKNQQREIARLQRFADRFRAKNTKASQAQSKLKQIERMEKIEAPQGGEATVDFRFPQPKRTGQRVVTLAGVRFAYGDNVIYENLDFEVERGQRTVLVGPNGAGKSTLLKLLAGVLVPQAGERRLGYHVKEGYYSQYRTEMLRPERTVLEEAFDTPQRLTETFVRTVLGSFLFRGDDVFKPVSVLSGGEKSRLALVKLLLDPPNLLLMDEPTTHLDLTSVDALLDALAQFEGTLVFISHDVYFIRELADLTVHVRNGRLTHYPGGYQYYLDKTGAGVEGARSAPSPPPQAAAPVPSGLAQERRDLKRLAAEQRQARSRQLKTARDAVALLEQEIHGLESRQAALTTELERPETYEQPGRAVQINLEIKTVIERLGSLTTEWEAAATRLAESEAQTG